MNLFVGLIDWTHGRVSVESRRPYESVARAAGLTFRWRAIGGLSALVGSDDDADADFVACHGAHIGIGDVRLDNRGEVGRWACCSDRATSDLELVLRLIANHGRRYIPRILGDFAFVVWNGATHTALAACDAFAVKKLYYTERNGVLAFAARGEARALCECYDVQYLAELLAFPLRHRVAAFMPALMPFPPRHWPSSRRVASQLTNTGRPIIQSLKRYEPRSARPRRWAGSFSLRP